MTDQTAPLGSPAHQALIAHVVAHYADDERIRAVAVFGSVGAGTWHELSDVDFDVVTEDGAQVDPGAEITALFGPRAVIVLAGADEADVVLDSREELSVRWHPLRATSPNIAATVRVVTGRLSAAQLVAAGDANRRRPDEAQRLDAVVRDAIYAQKALARGKRWEAVAAVERIRRSLTGLRGRRDGLHLDPADPAGALATVLAEVQADYDLGPQRCALLSSSDPGDAPAENGSCLLDTPENNLEVLEQALHDREGFYPRSGAKMLRDHVKATKTRPGRRSPAGTGNSRARQRAR